MKNTKIEYRNEKQIEAEQLQSLFLALGWSSGRYPEKLQLALQNYGAVFTAWDGERLVGLIGAIDDRVMTAYVHYLLVLPRYQGNGIGATLIEMLKEHYRDYLRVLLVGYPEAIHFYERHGFHRVKDESLRGEVPLYFTEMED